jgi:hypothetical protein
MFMYYILTARTLSPISVPQTGFLRSFTLCTGQNIEILNEKIYQVYIINI